MNPTKPGIQTTEFIATILSFIAGIVPVLLDKVPPTSVWYVIIGTIGAALAYVASRTVVKTVAINAAATVQNTSTAAAAVNPTK